MCALANDSLNRFAGPWHARRVLCWSSCSQPGWCAATLFPTTSLFPPARQITRGTLLPSSCLALLPPLSHPTEVMNREGCTYEAHTHREILAVFSMLSQTRACLSCGCFVEFHSFYAVTAGMTSHECTRMPYTPKKHCHVKFASSVMKR